ncbi:MAG: nitrile hydratase subunit alpha [Roseobacter sp.]
MPHDHSHPHNTPLSDTELRVKALESILTEKELIDPEAIDLIVETYETKIGPRNGARVVAKAWTDPDYKERLLSDATAAISELGFSGVQGEDMLVVENTDEVHNIVVCTLCSCYPWPTLGLPPVWYKAAPYRAKVVKDPRGVLNEFGVTLPEETEIRVWDSNAELRYLVLPKRPLGTGEMTESQLVDIVTRDSMIGTDVLSAH